MGCHSNRLKCIFLADRGASVSSFSVSDFLHLLITILLDLLSLLQESISGREGKVKNKEDQTNIEQDKSVICHLACYDVRSKATKYTLQVDLYKEIKKDLAKTQKSLQQKSLNYPEGQFESSFKVSLTGVS